MIRYLAYLAIVTTLITSTTLAKYSSEETLSVKSQVATFLESSKVDLNVALDDITPGGQKEVKFSVVNFEGGKTSDVDLEYEIQVATTGNLPLQFQLTGDLNGDTASADNRLVGELDQSTLKAAGGRMPLAEGAAGKKTHSYTLYVVWPNSADAVKYKNEIDMLTVTISSWQRAPQASGE